MISGSEPLVINMSGTAIFTSLKSKYYGLNPSFSTNKPGNRLRLACLLGRVPLIFFVRYKQIV